MDFWTNLLSGGVLGVLSSLFNGWLKYKDEQDRRRHQLALIRENAEANVREIEARVQVERQITEGRIKESEMDMEREESKGRTALIERLTGRYLSDDVIGRLLSDTSLTGMIFRPLVYIHILFMDALRGVVRPIITAGSIGFSFYVFYVSFEMYSKLAGIPNAQLLMENVILPMINLTIFVVSAVIGFWFSDKSAARRFQTQGGGK